MQNRSEILRIVLLALLLYAMAALLSACRELRETEETAADLEARLATLQEENLALNGRLQAAGSDEEMEQLARERLGLVMPGEKIFYFIG